MSLTQSSFRTVLLNLAVAGIYLLMAKSGMLFADDHPAAVSLWRLSGGFALAVVLLTGFKYLPGIFLAAFIIHLSAGDPLLVSTAIALGNSLQVALGGWLLSQRMKFDVAINRVNDFLQLILIGAPLVALTGAAIASAALMLAGQLDAESWLGFAIQWWMADLLGIVLLTPLILVYQQKLDEDLTPKKLSETTLILGLTFLAGQVIFLGWFHELTSYYPKGFMMFLFISVTAIRLGRHGVLLVLMMTAIQALMGASLGVGYFGNDIVETHLTSFWLFMLILSVDGMVLATYIREKHQVVAALRESENQFRTLANNTPVMVWMSGTNALCTYFNKVWLDFTGRTRAQELGKGWAEGVHPDDLQRCLDTYMTAFNAREEFSLEYRLRRYDGEYRSVIDHGVPRYNSRGKFLGYIGSVFDITDSKKAQTALYDSEIRFRELLEKIPLVSVQCYAADGTTNYWNQASEYLYGYTAEEALGKKITELIVPPEMQTEFMAAMRQMFETGQPIPASELTLMRKGGERIDVFSSHAYVHVPGRSPEMFCMDIDLTDRKKNEENIRNLAFYDPLTQLPNRRLLMDRMLQALAESHRNGSHGAILFFDLDNFKILNDTLGHDKGDLLLQQVAHRLVVSVREIDTVARLGGDEFVVMLKELSENPEVAAFQAETAGEKILALLNKPYSLAGTVYLSTPSIGITLFSDNKMTVEALLKRADIAMYEAKQAGRNTFRFFDPEMQTAVETRSTIEDWLRKALPEQQFRLCYQAQVDDAGTIHGAEVLLSWQQPERGMIQPADFIPLAEETGLIVPIGLWVLEKVCNQLKVWATDPNKRDLQLAVNISARQFRQPDFNLQVAHIIQKTGIDPSRLKLELTESLVLENVENAIEKMKILKQIGVQFAMDDFGTGYSSLSSLKKLPLDQIKIDQSFVRDIFNDPDNAVIVQTILAMASNLGIAVIAEGVETEQQKAFLAKHNCQYFQGYLFGKPVPIEQFEVLLTHSFSVC